jgi:isopentenyl-diphosphate Delta-isomerase
LGLLVLFMPKIILVNQEDKIIGGEEKLKVHQLGLLHRAFSIFIFNSKGELLLQQRAKGKHHSGGLWSNSCCSHQRPKELLSRAAHRRLKQEMGLVCKLKEIFNFRYKVKFANGLVENELDHVFVGLNDRRPKLNPEEASAFKYIAIKDLMHDIKINPDNYTAWLKIIMTKYYKRLIN